MSTFFDMEDEYELTELFRARDASCPKGKKMEIPSCGGKAHKRITNNFQFEELLGKSTGLILGKDLRDHSMNPLLFPFSFV